MDVRFVRGLGDPPADVDIDRLREAVADEPVELAVLFGSHATDVAGSLSDLDVGLLFHDEVTRSRRLELLDDPTAAIVDASGFEAVDVVDLDAVGPRLGYEALADGVLFHGDRSTAVDLETELIVRTLDFAPVKRAWDDALDARIRDDTCGRP